MAAKLAELPLIVIVGPTASGKTELAIKHAEEFDGEIICADSRTVYKGMDVGTAKPTATERQQVPHWGLDLVEPGQYFSVADFKEYSVNKIADIRSRSKVPFLVGGSGLYVDAVLFDYQFGREADIDWRTQLESMSLEELRQYCKNNNVSLPKDSVNKRRVIRAIEKRGGGNQRRDSPVSASIIVGIATKSDTLRTRIGYRAEHILTNGVVDEAMMLGKKYGWESEAMTGNIYPLVYDYAQGVLSAEELVGKFEILDWKLAKRQLTWFRRNPYIVWLTRDELVTYISDALTLDVS